MQWISVKDRLPEKSYFHDYLVWIPNDTKRGGYRELAAYGDYVCDNPDIQPDDPLYIADNDDGNMRGSGWHREEETHGGEYDYIFVDLNDKVTHWMPLPDPPEQS